MKTSTVTSNTANKVIDAIKNGHHRIQTILDFIDMAFHEAEVMTVINGLINEGILEVRIINNMYGTGTENGYYLAE